MPIQSNFHNAVEKQIKYTVVEGQPKQVESGQNGLLSNPRFRINCCVLLNPNM